MSRLVLAVASFITGDLAAAENAIRDARRIRPALSAEDFQQFSTGEILQGKNKAGLISAL
jgi:hypothetical protein